MPIDLTGYEDVNARRARFFDKYPDGSIQTSVPEYVQRPGGEYVVRVVATVFRTPDDMAPGVDTSEEPYPGRTPYTRDSEAENASTSAIGRAINCVLPGTGASRQEVAARHDEQPRTDGLATHAQKTELWRLAQHRGMGLGETAAWVESVVLDKATDRAPAEVLSALTAEQADTVIALLALPVASVETTVTAQGQDGVEQETQR